MATKAIVGEKVGMTQVWTEDGRVVPVTVVRVQAARIVQVKTPETDGYSAVQVTYGSRDPRKLTKPKAGQFAKAGVDAGTRLVELRLDDVSTYEVGGEIGADTFEAGDRVDVTAVSKGKGFAGPMKRHGFKGLPASHGAHRVHRAPGSIGACATPSRVFRGTKMAGRMGNERVTTQNLQIVKADAEAGVVMVKGSVPGPDGGVVLIRNATKLSVPSKASAKGGKVVKVDVKDVKGKGAGSAELDESWFGVEPNLPVMHQVVTAQLAAKRAGTQSTKTRSEVRGGGAKPWRQKGTGRARQGSSRAPHWVGGGVTHAPKPRSYAQKTPKKMIRLALRSALSDRAADGKIAVLDAWGFDAPSTKSAVAALKSLEVEGRVLVVLGDDDEAAWKSLRNLQDVHPISPRELNAYDVLVSDWVVFTRETLPSSEEKPAEAEVEIAKKPSLEKQDDGEDGIMKDPRDIILEPVVSEKSYALLDAGVYTFKVHPKASKPEIHDAVEAIFEVKVLKVNTLNRIGKKKKNRRTGTTGSRPATKRAIVTLAPGDRIELFEGS